MVVNGMRIGLDAYTIREFELDAFGMLDWAAEMGFEGVQYEDITKLTPQRDAGYLRELAADVKRRGMFAYVTVQRPNPYLFEGSAAQLCDAFRRDIELCAENGWTQVRANAGQYVHRVDYCIPYGEQLRATGEFLKQMRPVLRDCGVCVNLETHADATSYELLRIIETVGAEYIGITLDTGNLLIQGDYPVEAVKRLAPYTHLTHAKDGLLRLCDAGLVRQGMPPGMGSVEWETILPILAQAQPQIDLCIEDHKRLWYAQIFDEDWLRDHPDMTRYEMGQLVRLAWKTAKKDAQGLYPDMTAYEQIPYVEQARERLRFGREYLCTLLEKLGLRG